MWAVMIFSALHLPSSSAPWRYRRLSLTYQGELHSTKFIDEIYFRVNPRVILSFSASAMILKQSKPIFILPSIETTSIPFHPTRLASRIGFGFGLLPIPPCLGEESIIMWWSRMLDSKAIAEIHVVCMVTIVLPLYTGI